MASKNIAEANLTLRYLLRRLSDVLSKHVYGQLEGLGFSKVSEAHSAVIRNIAPEGSSVSALASAAQMTKQSMAYLVDGLERAGYLETQPDEHDRRAKRVRLTPRGLQLSETLVALGQAAEADLGRILDPGDGVRLRAILERANDRLRAGAMRAANSDD